MRFGQCHLDHQLPMAKMYDGHDVGQDPSASFSLEFFGHYIFKYMRTKEIHLGHIVANLSWPNHLGQEANTERMGIVADQYGVNGTVNPGNGLSPTSPGVMRTRSNAKNTVTTRINRKSSLLKGQLQLYMFARWEWRGLE